VLSFQKEGLLSFLKTSFTLPFLITSLTFKLGLRRKTDFKGPLRPPLRGITPFYERGPEVRLRNLDGLANPI